MTRPPGMHTYADYNGAGVLWLLGNNSNRSMGTIAEGNAPKATIIAMGNTYLGNKKQLAIVAKKKLALNNMIDVLSLHKIGVEAKKPKSIKYKTAPKIEQGITLKNYPAELKPPVPSLLRKVKILLWKNTPPKKLLISVKKFGAVGDGKTDDSVALQKAIDKAGWRLYFPPGTYITTKTLGLNNSDISKVRHSQAGGWWSGAGSAKTIIKNISGGSVFVTNGIAFYKFEGITFQTKAYGDNPCFSVNNVVKKGGRNCKANHFIDCRFVGGSIAFGIGLKFGPQVDFHYNDQCTFEKAKQGYAIGCFNNLQEIVTNSRFIDNDIDCGHTLLGQGGGGTAGFYNCVTTGNRVKFLDLHKQGTALWYFFNIKGIVPQIVDLEASKFAFMIFFDRSKFQSKKPQLPLIKSACAGTISLNQTELKKATVELYGKVGPKDINIHIQQGIKD